MIINYGYLPASTNEVKFFYLWNVPIQIFAICYIILEVNKGFRYRKGWRSTLEKKLLYILGQFHFYKNITTCLEVIYQAWDAVFHHQMKHREDWKYDAQRSIFTNKCLIVLLKQNDFRRRNKKLAVFYLISKHSLNINFPCIFFMNN